MPANATTTNITIRPSRRFAIWIAAHYKIALLIILYLGILFRGMLIPNRGFEADIAFWKSWGMAQNDFGVVKGLEISNNNYPTPFNYVLGGMNLIYRLMGNPHNWYDFWMNNNLRYLFVAKLPSILADFGIFFLFLLIGKKAERFGFPKASNALYLFLGALYLLNPVSLMDGAWWGQVDSLGVVIFLGAILLALNKQPFWAGFIFMVSMMTKLQNMIYGPLFFLFLWYVLGYKGMVRGIIGACVSFVVLNIEFILQRKTDMVINSLTMNYDYFPWMSLNAYNLWWIVSGAAGMKMSDKVLSVGIMNAKTMGLLLFSSFYLMAFLGLLIPIFSRMKKMQLLEKKIVLPKIALHAPDPEFTRGLFLFLIGLVIVANAFFLFQTESHDRYAFPLSVFLLLMVPFMNHNERKLWLFGYGLWSLLFFYNLHNALIENYPTNGIPFFTSMNWSSLTITVSIGLILAFFIFLFAVRKHVSVFTYLIPFGIIGLGVFALNLPLVTKSPVSLTKFIPVIAQQGFGFRAIDMPVGKDLDYTKWDRLSVQYAFYKHGFGTHSNSVMNFDIGRNFKQFTTDYGIDTAAGSGGNGTFEIYGDGKLLFRSEKIGRFDNPRHTEVDITGVKTLGLVTTDAGDGINDDHTDWLNPKLWPK
jgi:hypothetical protein